MNIYALFSGISMLCAVCGGKGCNSSSSWRAVCEMRSDCDLRQWQAINYTKFSETNSAQVVRRRQRVSLSLVLHPLAELHSNDFCFGCAWRGLIYSCLCSSQNLCTSNALREKVSERHSRRVCAVQNSTSFEHIHGFAAHEFCIPEFMVKVASCKGECGLGCISLCTSCVFALINLLC
jgi:hypothetical protein